MDMSGEMNKACFLVSSTCFEYLFEVRASAPHAMIMRMLARASLATAPALPLAYFRSATRRLGAC